MVLDASHFVEASAEAGDEFHEVVEEFFVWCFVFFVECFDVDSCGVEDVFDVAVPESSESVFVGDAEVLYASVFCVVYEFFESFSVFVEAAGSVFVHADVLVVAVRVFEFAELVVEGDLVAVADSDVVCCYVGCVAVVLGVVHEFPYGALVEDSLAERGGSVFEDALCAVVSDGLGGDPHDACCLTDADAHVPSCRCRS